MASEYELWKAGLRKRTKVFASATIRLFCKLPTNRVEVAGLYWHFVDIVWIVIFVVVYLVPAGEAATKAGR